MTFVHWLEAIWFLSLGVVWAQMYLVNRSSRTLRRETERLRVTMTHLNTLIAQYEVEAEGTMRYSEAGLVVTKHFEGLKLTSYQDQGGTWTIGYGHTTTARPGQTITEEQADALLRQDVRTAEDCVNRAIQVPLNQYQFDALVDFTFNLGCSRLRSSTLLGHINRSNFEGAAQEFKRWKFIGTKESAGLIRRRAQNEATFRTKPAPNGADDANREANG